MKWYYDTSITCYNLVFFVYDEVCLKSYSHFVIRAYLLVCVSCEWNICYLMVCQRKKHVLVPFLHSNLFCQIFLWLFLWIYFHAHDFLMCVFDFVIFNPCSAVSWRSAFFFLHSSFEKKRGRGWFSVTISK